MVFRFLISLTVFLFWLNGSCFSQEFYKLECDLIIKEMDSTGISLLKGHLIFDKYQLSTEIDFTFPKKEKWIITHDSLVKEVDGIEVFRNHYAHINAFSVFNLFLKGTLKHFGLKNTKYNASHVEVNERGWVMTTWSPPEEEKHLKFGRVITGTNEGNLMVVALYDHEGRMTSKLLFRKYIDLKGLQFPSEMLQIGYDKGEKNKKLFSYHHVELE